MLIIVVAYPDQKLVAQDANDTSAEREVFTIVEEQPSYTGGMDAFYRHLMKELRYPAVAREHGIEGLVKVQFNIERDGSVSDVHTIRDVGAGCGPEVERIMKSVTSFEAGSQRGRTVKTAMVIPVTFKIDPDKTNADDSPQGGIIIGELEMKMEHLQIDVKYKSGAWHGTLTDNNGKPLPGANIIVEGTTYGRVSGLDGTFTVDADASQDVVISYVGYESVRLSEKDMDKE